MVESWTRSRSSEMREIKQLRYGCKGGEQKRMLSPRTVLNGGERGQEHARKAKEKIEDPPQDQPKWWRSGAVNLVGPYLYLYPCFMATFVLAFILAFLAPLGDGIFALLWCNGEKWRILSRGGGIPFGAFGWALACAHSGLRRRFAFYWSWFKAGIYGARRERRGGRSSCRR